MPQKHVENISEEEEKTDAQLKYLAKILVKIFLDRQRKEREEQG